MVNAGIHILGFCVFGVLWMITVEVCTRTGLCISDLLMTFYTTISEYSYTEAGKPVPPRSPLSYARAEEESISSLGSALPVAGIETCVQVL